MFYLAKDITLGADPEVFVEHEDGKLFPAFTFLPDKYNPLKTPEGQNCYWDGFQTEFNIKPSNFIGSCLKSIKLGLQTILDAARIKDPKAKLSTKTVVNTPIESLKGLPLEFIEFGCMPSYNLYDIGGRGASGQETPYRFAGGHIHFGIQGVKYQPLVKALDSILGVASVSLFENIDNPVRRQYYGLAGEYRLPPHGLEYRTLSDAWLFNPILASTILRFARQIVLWTLNNKNDWEASTDEVIKCILTNDVKLAREIIRRNMFRLPRIGYNASDADFNIDLMKPVEKSVDMRSIANNWNLH